jgi:glycosyltransferase involved in cell wall biosynthesis
MNSPEVSIIVCIYNAEKYLSRCIDSIIAQTFTHFECILIDDGSTDNSLSICERYRQSDDRIIVIHQENSGVSAARNKGIEVARGKYIFFVDSDDYIQQNMYEKLVAAINDSDTDAVCCGYTENKKPYALCNEDFIFSNTSTIEIVHYLEMRQAFGIVWNKLY